jgi:hypothetical protein
VLAVELRHSSVTRDVAGHTAPPSTTVSRCDVAPAAVSAAITRQHFAAETAGATGGSTEPRRHACPLRGLPFT